MKRSPKQPQLLDWEELEQAPNTRGAFSFLKASATVVKIDEHQAPISSAGISHHLLNTKAVAPDKTSTVDKPSTVHKTSTVDDPNNERRRYRIHPCQLAQDGHSGGENLLYDALWKVGRIETESTRIVTMGWDRMAHAAHMSDKAAKRNLAQLISKLAVEQIAAEDSSTRTGRTYRVFSFTSILERRQRAGMTHVVKDKGVRFVSADEGRSHADLQNRASLGTGRAAWGGNKTSTVDKTYTVDNPSTDTVDKTSRDTVDKTSPLLGSILGTKERKATTTYVVDVAAVAAVLCQYAPGDREAAERIVKSARIACPDCTTADVIAAVRRKATQLQGQQAIKSPVGVLITSCSDLVVAAHVERVTAEVRRREEAAKEEQASHESAFLSLLDGLPSDNVWTQILDRVRHHIPAQSYETWLKPTRFVDLSVHTLQICVPSSEFKCIGDKYADHFANAIQDLDLNIDTVEFLTVGELTCAREVQANAL